MPNLFPFPNCPILVFTSERDPALQPWLNESYLTALLTDGESELFDQFAHEYFRQPSVEGVTASLGRGRNSLNGLSVNYAIKRPAPQPTTINRTEGFIERVVSYSHLLEKLGISASASFSGYLGSVKGKLELARTIESSSFGVTVLIRINVIKQLLTIVGATFTEEARRILRDPAQFLETYGDLYCSDVAVGGEFYAIARFHSSSTKEDRYLRGRVDAVAGPTSVDIELINKLKTLEGISTTQIQVYRSGTLSSLPDYKDIYTYALKFPQDVSQSGGETIERYLPYETVLGRPEGVRVPNLVRKFNLLARMAASKNDLLEISNDIGYIKSHSNEFVSPDIQEISRKENTAKAWLSALDSEAQAIQQDPVHHNPVMPRTDPASLLPLAMRKESVPVPLQIAVYHDSIVTSGREHQQIGDFGFQGVTILSTVHRDLEIWGRICYNNHIAPGLWWSLIEPDFVNMSNLRLYRFGIKGLSLKLKGPLADHCVLSYRVRLNTGFDSGFVPAEVPAGLWAAAPAPWVNGTIISLEVRIDLK